MQPARLAPAPTCCEVRCNMSLSTKKFLVCRLLPGFAPHAQVMLVTQSALQPHIRLLAAFSFGRGVWTGPRTVCSVGPLQEHCSSLVFLHGLGDTGEGVEQVAQLLQPHLEHTKFIFPTSRVQPVTSRGGMRMFSWYVGSGVWASHADGITQLGEQ